MDFTYTYEDLLKFSTLSNKEGKNGKIFIENQDYLLKAIKEDLSKSIDMLISIPEHPHIIKPISQGSIIYSNLQEGVPYKTLYRMQYLKKARTFLELEKLDIDYQQKIIYSRQVFEALHFLHQYIVLGDIHSDNLLVCNDSAYLSDLDYSKKIDSLFLKIPCSYSIRFFDSKYTDIIKLYLECLSLVLGISFEGYITKFGYKKFCQTILGYHLPDEITTFLKLSLHERNFKKLGEEAYDFDRFMNEEILSLKHTLSFFDYYK